MLFFAKGYGFADLENGIAADSEQLGVPMFFKIVLGAGVFSAVLTAGTVVVAVLAWKDGYRSAAFRAYYTPVTAAAVAFV
jgi:hypothetical protein